MIGRVETGRGQVVVPSEAHAQTMQICKKQHILCGETLGHLVHHCDMFVCVLFQPYNSMWLGDINEHPHCGPCMPIRMSYVP